MVQAITDNHDVCHVLEIFTAYEQEVQRQVLADAISS